ncbi:MAG: alpha/beta hydrolase [Alphaproteobacteria bacterium]|nr:alpha/beta hydrolase [Alphaproteobacteria bacterium]
MKRPKTATRIWILTACILFSFVAVQTAAAGDGKLRERLRDRLQQKSAEGDGMFSEDAGGSCADHYAKIDRRIKSGGDRLIGSPPDVKDVAYGTHERQRFDVYLPKGEAARGGPAPMILMAHGGGWCVGDKSLKSTVQNKVARWTAKGFVVASTNYPMLTHGRDALAQAHEVAAAAAFLQKNAGQWGGDSTKLILMGHSAGAHLVSLVGTAKDIRDAAGMQDVLGVVSIDAGATDLEMQMPKVLPFLKVRYTEAFGADPARWPQMSPFHRLDKTSAPWLGICSTTRPDKPCEQSEAYVQKSLALGIPAAMLALPKGHGKLNSELGQKGSYTDSVEKFMASLDTEVAARLR